MGNIYFVDKKYRVWDHKEETSGETIMVHSWRGLEKLDEVKKRFTFAQVKGMFCSFCGNFMPCGCDKPTTQKVGEEAETITLDVSKLEPIETWHSKLKEPDPNCKDCKGTGESKVGEVKYTCPCSLEWYKV